MNRALRLNESLNHAADALLRSVEAGTDTDELSAITFSGIWQDAIPRGLILDRNLKPIDKLAWQVLRTHVSQPGQVVSPTYDVLSREMHCARATLATALAALRLTRWISARVVKAPEGRTVGSVYQLHDEALDIGVIQLVDRDYMPYLVSRLNATDRTSSLARMIREQFLADFDEPCTPGSRIEPPEIACSSKFELPDSERGSKIELTRNTPGSEFELPDSTAVQKLNCPRTVVGSCSGSSRKTTTTTDTLRLPEKLAEDLHEAARLAVAPLPLEQAQAVLDELGGNLATRSDIRSPVSFLVGIVRKAQNGGFVPSHAAAQRATAQERESIERSKQISDALHRYRLGETSDAACVDDLIQIGLGSERARKLVASEVPFSGELA